MVSAGPNDQANWRASFARPCSAPCWARKYSSATVAPVTDRSHGCVAERHCLFLFPEFPLFRSSFVVYDDHSCGFNPVLVSVDPGQNDPVFPHRQGFGVYLKNTSFSNLFSIDHPLEGLLREEAILWVISLSDQDQGAPLADSCQLTRYLRNRL